MEAVAEGVFADDVTGLVSPLPTPPVDLPVRLEGAFKLEAMGNVQPAAVICCGKLVAADGFNALTGVGKKSLK